MATLSAPTSTRSSSNTASYEDILGYSCSLVARSPQSTYAFDFSGRDYCMMLHAICPGAVDPEQVCWAMKPIRPQLEGNLQYFMRCAQKVGIKPPFPEELQWEMLAPNPKNAAKHLQVLTWLHQLGMRFPVAADYDPTAVIKQRVVKPTLSLSGGLCSSTGSPTPLMNIDGSDAAGETMAQRNTALESQKQALHQYFEDYQLALHSMIFQSDIDYKKLASIPVSSSSR